MLPKLTPNSWVQMILNFMSSWNLQVCATSPDLLVALGRLVVSEFISLLSLSRSDLSLGQSGLRANLSPVFTELTFLQCLHKCLRGGHLYGLQNMERKILKYCTLRYVSTKHNSSPSTPLVDSVFLKCPLWKVT